MCKCNKCDKIFKNKAGLKSHINHCGNKIKINHICPICGCYINNSISKHIKSCKGEGTRRSIKRREGGQKWLSGKTYDELYGIEKSKDIKNKISNKLTGVSKGIGGTIEKENIRRDKIRNKILERYSNGWEVKCGRCKKIDYFSEIAGNVKLDGGWELATAKYLDSIKVEWIRNKKRFRFWNSLKNRESTYCPDFYVKDWNKS